MNKTNISTDWGSMSVAELEQAVATHNRLYWLEDAPVISDVEFDRLIETLREKSPSSAILDAIGPQGANLEAAMAQESAEEPALAPLHGAHQIAHDPPMLSLNKCYTEDELHKWFERFEGDALVSPKIDGVAVSIRYGADGHLETAATRGTGRVGELITDNVRQIQGVPHEIDAPSLEVRGEAYIPLSVFRERFAAEYASPRNLAAGALKLKDASAAAGYGVRFFAYDALGIEFDTEAEKMRWLAEIGFDPVDCEVVAHDQLQAAFDRIESTQLERDYQMDGVVYRVNRRDEQVRMGYTSHHPRYSIAYKFQGDSGESVLREVHWNVSRTGAINPVGIVDPVTLSGAVVTRASLHNLAIMEAIGGPDGLRLDSRVEMTRRGGVIPHLERVIDAGNDPVSIPEVCPACGAPTYRDSDVLTADHRQDCQAARMRQLEHFTSQMEIKGIGPKLLEQLYDSGLVSDASDFYTLTQEELTGLERVGERTAQNLLAQIEANRRVPVERFLRALGIDELGRHVAGILATHYQSLDEVLAVTPEELVEIPTIGEIIARKVTEGFVVHAELIASLRAQLELVFPAPLAELDDATLESSPVAGRAFLFTGTLESMTRAAAQKRVAELGGQTPSSVLKSLNYLVIGDADMEKFAAGWRSSKLKKATQYNDDGAQIEIIGETEFLELLTRAEVE